MSIHLGAYDQYVLAVVVLLGTLLAVLALLWLTQLSPYAAYLRTYRGIAQNFLTVINVIFALNLAFLANDTWNARDRALNGVQEEAGSLRTIAALAGDLPAEAQTVVRNALAAYAHAAVVSEWPRLGARRSSPEAAVAFDRLVAALAGEEIARGLAPPVHALMLQQASQIGKLRDLRLALSQTHVNPLKWLGMAFLGLLTMISIAMVHVDTPRAEFLAVLLFAVAAAPTAAIILIHGNPFQEPMAVSAAPIAAVLHGLLTAPAGAV